MRREQGERIPDGQVSPSPDGGDHSALPYYIELLILYYM